MDTMMYDPSMDIYGYFKYEKQLVDDLQAVKTAAAKKELSELLKSVLDDHERRLRTTVEELHAQITEYKAAILSAAEKKTPGFVKRQMEKFGFKDLEEDNSAGSFGFSSFRDKDKSLAEKAKRLCGTEDDARESNEKKPATDITDREADRQNARIFSAIAGGCSEFGSVGEAIPAAEFFGEADAKEKAKADVKEMAGGEVRRKPARKGKAKNTAKTKLAEEKPE